MRLPSLRSWRFQRDTTIWMVALSLLTYEVFNDGRASVIAGLVTLLATPIALRADERRRDEESSP